MPAASRNRLYKLLRVGKTELRMDEDAYRALLARHGAKEKDGRASATTMPEHGLLSAVAEMKAKGFRPKPGRGSAANAARSKRGLIAKITALWCTLADAGVVRDRGEVAMVRWCARHTSVANLQWAAPADLVKCIESLKRWAQRERIKLR